MVFEVHGSGNVGVKVTLNIYSCLYVVIIFTIEFRC